MGNLVCPAEFRVGEDAKAMVCSVTEGEDKPLKYPLMFRTCELVVVNKIDLLPHLDFDLDALLRNVESVNPGARCIQVSARTGEGVEAFRDWLAGVAGARAGGGVTEAVAVRGSTSCSALRTEAGAGSSRPRPSGSRRAVPPDGRALRRAAGGCWRWAARRRRARTPATWPWSSCTR